MMKRLRRISVAAILLAGFAAPLASPVTDKRTATGLFRPSDTRLELGGSEGMLVRIVAMSRRGVMVECEGLAGARFTSEIPEPLASPLSLGAEARLTARRAVIEG